MVFGTLSWFCLVAMPAWGSIAVTSNGAAKQLTGSELPSTTLKEFSMLWESSNPNNGLIVYTTPSASPYYQYRSTTSTAGLNWSPGMDTGLVNPHAAPQPSADVRNAVVRDFDQNGNLVGFFGTRQGTYGGSFGANDVLFRATSSDGGVTWSDETMITFNSGAFSGQTGINGFVEVFETTSGILRGYLAGNATLSNTTTHLVESSDGGLTWTDKGLITIPGAGTTNSVVSANSPVFWFTDLDDGILKLGWLVFGEGNGRGVNLLVSTDEGLTWTREQSFANANIRSGDANFISDNTVRLFYYESVSSVAQTWYEDFTITGAENIRPNNLTSGPETTDVVPEPSSLCAWCVLAVVGLVSRRGARRRRG
jgi:hypothetical protein